ncbi:DUF1549 and DUF1553 domain-containing protein [Stieleria varia]|uniref:Cytochrome c domain-containing protein n=1 Tax=Stieleria varia TaxID=2528005 RepID=A0A5C5ZKW8_9BACT|nr:DUF1549 and DUF1553 domain-containing protein [Stieleria varia]TWT88072.1 hypothetical protein Pla52n_69230 [Stieleria varia]
MVIKTSGVARHDLKFDFATLATLVPRMLAPRILGRSLLVTALLLCVLTSDAFAQKRNSAKKPAPPKIRLPESVRSKEPVRMDVAAVRPDGRSAARSAANRLDSLVERKLIDESVTPNELASDEVFLRRIYLDVAGRIPKLEEATEFLDDSDPNKREKLIDKLLSSPDYVSHMYNFWADVLRLVERPQANIVADPYLAYVKDSIRTNKPYDKWVYEMLTADGKVWENPAVGYQLRDDGMPLPYIDNTVRIFLGTQIGCAQCHDHPFDQWTQYQFYELAAYTAGTRTRIRKGDPGYTKGNPANDLINEARNHYDKGRVPGQFQRLVRANTYRVAESKAVMKLPHDYAYLDAKPNEVVKPAVLWGEVPTSAANSTPREQFAAWLTSRENERFSKTLVNRLWKQFMGVGLVEPIDDFRDENPCVNEPLMDFLADEFVKGQFDVKELIRAVLYSNTYQRQSSDYELTSGQPYYFPGPALRRLSAEQIWDSMLTLAVYNPLPFQRPDAEAMAGVMDLDFSRANFESVKKQSERFSETFFMGNYKRELNKHAYQGNVLCRASELPSPSSASHFLRQFGQGDRETINGAQQDATVPQILAMFNGPITHVMLEEGSAIVDKVLAIDKAKDRIDAIFLSVLARLPNQTDRAIAASELSKTKNDNVGYGNIIWALLNTREFLFIQ